MTWRCPARRTKKGCHGRDAEHSRRTCRFTRIPLSIDATGLTTATTFLLKSCRDAVAHVSHDALSPRLRIVIGPGGRSGVWFLFPCLSIDHFRILFIPSAHTICPCSIYLCLRYVPLECILHFSPAVIFYLGMTSSRPAVLIHLTFRGPGSWLKLRPRGSSLRVETGEMLCLRPVRSPVEAHVRM